MLEPVLFTIFISDVAVGVCTAITKFGDDTSFSSIATKCHTDKKNLPKLHECGKKNTQDYVDKGKILYLVMPTWCSVTKRPQTLVTNNSLNSQIDNMAQQAKKPTKWWASSGRPPRTWQKLSFCHHKVLLNLHLDSCVYLWNDVWRRTFNLRMCREG